MYSVIIPAKNEKDNIVRCIQSIYASVSTPEFVEVIVVDNGSTDNTPELAENMGAKVFVQKDLNIAGLRNYGAQQASNQIIAFIDADCEVNSNWLAYGYSTLNDNDDIGIIGGQYQCPENSTWVQRAWNSVRPKGVQVVNFVTSGNFFAKKDVFNRFGGFDEDLETGEDYDLCERISKQYEIISDDKLNVIHHGDPATLIQKLRKERWYGRNTRNILKRKPLYLPFWISVFLLANSISLFFGLLSCNLFIIFSCILIGICLISGVCFYKCLKVQNFKYFIPLIVIYSTYFLGRILSLNKFFTTSTKSHNHSLS